MRLRLFAAGAAAALLATLTLTAPAAATHSSGYHWARTANPFTLKLDDNVTAAWDNHLSVASADWSASSVLDTVVMQGNFGDRNACSPITGHVEICNAAYGNTGWLSVVSIGITTGNHINRAYVKLNDTYFAQAPYNSSAFRQMTMCAGIGRTLGLTMMDNDPANPNQGSCLDYSANPSGPPSNEHPGIHDYEQLAIIYKHLDSFTTPTVNPLGVVEQPTWGRLIAGSADHGVGVYVRAGGFGSQVLTHVFWA